MEAIRQQMMDRTLHMRSKMRLHRSNQFALLPLYSEWEIGQKSDKNLVKVRSKSGQNLIKI